MTKTQKQLINYVKAALHGETFLDSADSVTTKEKNSVIEYGKQQGLLPFLQYFPEFFMEDVRDAFCGAQRTPMRFRADAQQR